MSTTTPRTFATARNADAFLSELISALPIVILYRAVRASWHASTDIGGSLQTAASR